MDSELSSIFFTLIPIAAAFWVYFDAYQNRIGTYRDELNRLRGHSPVWWGALTLLLLIVFLPIYLIRRKTLLEIAKEHPANSDKSIGILVISILSVIIFWYYNFNY
ncbi:hypothetical protein; putative membrane protein [Xenorhabdus nematophila ATCC 19061]|uniref:Uncharacterized protein n=1 Tax=Xenorhabdus nematophila (strain ATCC 19061 / DSM 3370 / CCUG 14189 / LMG 1036 / NCIMB 9965 / AN6) TaxID=406817 RepID=D3V965_XENNA|nr:hypothetical protein [Xenorhabdus nematophila]CBJ91415.1 hypothetical protein; putative membrane protein [Xenorhabdus nematophila ATCC 19061]CEE93703.1 hypothetical protein; putative membrane protein [Xenorhabdus nematophila str. Anatoliense]CEK24236.1 hypothetical protein; putative membrane protein [Xenorhabdus nematophila AN6/1]